MNALSAFIVTVLLLLINAFFVAGEFATTSARRSQIEPLADQGVRGSKQAMYALEHVSLMLAICQLGITVASTSLGVVAEPALAHLVEGPLVAVGLPAASAHVVGFTLALIVVVVAHVVIGEMVPKNIAIATPSRSLLLLATPLVFLGRIIKPLITVMDSLANWILRRFGIDPRSEISSTFTVEEVASIVELSAQEGMIDDDLGLLSGTHEFSTETAQSTMIPADDLVTLKWNVTPAELEREVAQTGYSRFPILGESGGLAGYIHLKDILHATAQQRDEAIEPWRIRAMVRVRGTDEVEDALRDMQKSGTHLAEVADEAGQIIGVLFLEDVIEELVGEVQDSLQRDL